jgi:hypothetical protein
MHSLMGCLRVGVIRRVAWMLWLKILPLWLKLTVRPLHLELMTLWWHGGPESAGTAVERTLWLHQMGSGVSIGQLPCESCSFLFPFLCISACLASIMMALSTSF